MAIGLAGDFRIELFNEFILDFVKTAEHGQEWNFLA